ncbi:MAG: nitrilase-related carbon-nitrogen hydrolase [Planctomycetota bacterium]
MKIGFVQLSPVLGDRAATLRQLDRMAEEFRRADLVVLPELRNSGYNFASMEQARSTAEDARDGAFVQYLASLIKRHHQYIVAGINEIDAQDGRVYNTAELVGPEGHIGKYRKGA